MKTVKIGNVSLPIAKGKKYVPEEQNIIGANKELEQLAYAAKANMPVLMIGETGSGKTSLVRYLAAKSGNGFRRLNLNGQTTTDEFVGKILLGKKGTYWQDGVLIEAMREGYWLLLDEINAALPEILFSLHSLLDDDGYVVLAENDGEIVRPHEDFRIFATMNPPDKYEGTKELNKAFLSRFPMILQQSYQDAETETRIVKEIGGASEGFAQSLVKMAADIRDAYHKDEIDTILSTRDLVNIATLEAAMGMKDALMLGVINRANKDDRKAIATMVKLYFGEDFSKPAANTREDLIKSLRDEMRDALKLAAVSAKSHKDSLEVISKNYDKGSDLKKWAEGERINEVVENITSLKKSIEKISSTFQQLGESGYRITEAD